MKVACVHAHPAPHLAGLQKSSCALSWCHEGRKRPLIIYKNMCLQSRVCMRLNHWMKVEQNPRSRNIYIYNYDIYIYIYIKSKTGRVQLRDWPPGLFLRINWGHEPLRRLLIGLHWTTGHGCMILQSYWQKHRKMLQVLGKHRDWCFFWRLVNVWDLGGLSGPRTILATTWTLECFIVLHFGEVALMVETCR